MRPERWTGIAGVATIAILIPAIVMESVGPNAGMSPSEMAARFASAQVAVLLGSVLLLAAQVTLFVFAIGLATLTRSTSPVLSMVLLVSAAVSIAASTVYEAVFASVASSIRHIHSNDVVYGLFIVATSMDTISGSFAGILIGVGAYALRRSNLLGAWLTRLGVVTGAIVFVSAIGIVDPQAFVLTLIAIIGAFLSLLWILLVSISLVRIRTAPTER